MKACRFGGQAPFFAYRLCLCFTSVARAAKGLAPDSTTAATGRWVADPARLLLVIEVDIVTAGLPGAGTIEKQSIGVRQT